MDCRGSIWLFILLSFGDEAAWQENLHTYCTFSIHYFPVEIHKDGPTFSLQATKKITATQCGCSLTELTRLNIDVKNKKIGINNKPSHLHHLIIVDRVLILMQRLWVFVIICLISAPHSYVFFPYLFHSLLFLTYFKKGGPLDAWPVDVRLAGLLMNNIRRV